MKKATSLQGSLSSENESNPIKKIDMNKRTPLNAQQGLRTLHSVAHARYACFFVPLNQFFIGRGGAVPYKSGFAVKTVRRSVTVLNTPIALRSNHLREITGEHTHA